MPIAGNKSVLDKVAEFIALTNVNLANMNSEAYDTQKRHTLLEINKLKINDIRRELDANPELLEDVLKLRKYARSVVIRTRAGAVLVASSGLAITVTAIATTYGTAAFLVPLIVAAPFGAVGVGMSMGSIYLSKFQLLPHAESMKQKYQNSPNSELGNQLRIKINSILERMLLTARANQQVKHITAVAPSPNPTIALDPEAPTNAYLQRQHAMTRMMDRARQAQEPLPTLVLQDTPPSDTDPEPLRERSRSRSRSNSSNLSNLL